MGDELLARLDASRSAFMTALEAVDADLVTVPGVMEDWSVRDIVVHVAAWCEHATNALELAVTGRGDEFAYSTAETDAMNVRFLAEARRTSPAAALKREEAAFSALRERVARLDPALLVLHLGNGDTVAEVIAYDGPDHYAEHTDHLRAWFTPEDHEDGNDVLDDA